MSLVIKSWNVRWHSVKKGEHRRYLARRACGSVQLLDCNSQVAIRARAARIQSFNTRLTQIHGTVSNEILVRNNETRIYESDCSAVTQKLELYRES